MKRHDTDVVSLVFALVFLLVAAMWPLWTVGVLDTASLRWVPATALVLIGVVGVALSILRSRNPATEAEPWRQPRPVDRAAYYAPASPPYGKREPAAGSTSGLHPTAPDERSSDDRSTGSNPNEANTRPDIADDTDNPPGNADRPSR